MSAINPNIESSFTVMDYLHGKVADYTVSDNVIVSTCFDREIDHRAEACTVEKRLMELAYADLLNYVYLQPGLTKSYSQTNGTWSQKEGATQLSSDDKKKILAEMRRIYGKYDEVCPIQPKSTVRMIAHGMKFRR